MANMSDDVSSAVVGISMQAAQKGLEIAGKFVDKTIDGIAKLLQFLFQKKDGKSAGGDVKSTDLTDIKPGEVSVKDILTNAKKSGDTLISQDGFSEKDMNFIKGKAQEYGIPVAFTSKEDKDNICAHCRGSDKAVFERITTEMIKKKLAERPQELGNFKAEKWELPGIQKELEKHDLSANWGQMKNGEYFCLYEKSDQKAILMARGEFVRKCKEVENDFKAEKGGDGFYTLKDEKSGNTVTFDEIPSKEQLSQILQEKFGYDENKAEIACGKFGEQHLNEQQRKAFFAENPQSEFDKIETNIELKNENILVKGYDCLRVIPKSDGIPKLVYRDENNNFAVLRPEKMNRRQMSEILRESLGITDENTLKALVEKAEKVADFYNNQNDENLTHSPAPTEGGFTRIEAEIERLDGGSFAVNSTAYKPELDTLSLDGDGKFHESGTLKSLVLSFSDKKTALAELAAMYESQGLTTANAKQAAKETFAKAKAQSPEKVLQIQQIKVDNNMGNSAVMTVKFGNQTEKIDITDREKAVAEISEKFDVSKEAAGILLDKADDKIAENVAQMEEIETQDASEELAVNSEVNWEDMPGIEAKPAEENAVNLTGNGHEKNPAEPTAPDIGKGAELPEIETPKARKR
jgi:phosphopantetheinyl transferase (holo-ACP synthase)